MFLIAAVSSFSLNAQKYEPRESWPLVFEDFLNGETLARDGKLFMDAPLNVSVVDGSLLFVDKNGVIMKADMSRIHTVRIGDTVFVNLFGKLYELISELDSGSVVSQTVVDKDKYGKVDIGYGVSSASASAMNLTILMDGRSDLINKSLEQSEENKYKSPVIPIRENIFLFVKGNLVPVSRNAIINYPGVDGKEARDFIKKEKIKWKDTESLEKLVIFLHNQLND